MSSIYFNPNTGIVRDFLGELGFDEATINSGVVEMDGAPCNASLLRSLSEAKRESCRLNWFSHGDPDASFLSRREAAAIMRHHDKEILLAAFRSPALDSDAIVANVIGRERDVPLRVSETDFEDLPSQRPEDLDGVMFTPEQIPQAIEEASKAVVKIEADNLSTSGTGVIVNETGGVQTAHHVVLRDEGAEAVSPQHIKTQTGQVVGINDSNLKARDAHDDQVTLKAPELAGKPHAVAANYTPAIGDTVWLAGYAGLVQGLSYLNPDALVLTVGTVAAVDERGILINGLAHPGMSGGPLFDSAGHYLGTIAESMMLPTWFRGYPDELQSVLSSPSLVENAGSFNDKWFWRRWQKQVAEGANAEYYARVYRPQLDLTAIA